MSELLVEGSLRISGILAIALAVIALLRHRSAALRHGILAAAIAGAALTPALARALPAWRLPAIASPGIRAWLVAEGAGAPRLLAGPSVVSPAPTAEMTRASDMSAAAARGGPSGVSGVQILLTAWAAGAATLVLGLIAGLGRLTWIAWAARPLSSGPWVAIADEVAREYGLRRRVRLLLSDRSSLLVTWGFARPAVLLPRGSADWPADRIRIVLLHELAHIVRGDWAIQLLGEFVRAANWFNPLVWIACRRLRRESEHAADDAVLNRGVKGAAYAAELVALARTFVPTEPGWLPAAAIARPSSLEQRVRAMLDGRINRRPTSRAARVVAACALAATVAAIASAQGVFSSFSGVVYDQTNALLPNVKILLTNSDTSAKYEIRSDASGRFEFVGLPPGRYAFETERLGFGALRGTLEIAGQNVERNVRLLVGSLQETLSISASEANGQSPQMVRRLTAADRARQCEASRPDAASIGGDIRPPTKLVHVNPDYPPALAAAGQGGVVVLDTLIAEDGAMREVRVVSSPNPALADAAAAAVWQWEFSQTLLNCVPVEVRMRVTARFNGE